jgi:hypothetical protein
MIAQSENGKTWTKVASPSDFGTSTIRTVAGANGRFTIAAILSYGAAIAFSKDLGATWRVASSSLSNTPLGFVYSGKTWVACCSNGVTQLLPGVKTYASAADLEDDTLAPDAGTYGIFLDSAGSYIRLGSPAFGIVTCDPVEGATSADRTHAQIFARILDERTDFISGTDWSTTDITALDASIAYEIGIFIPDGDRVNVADALDRIASSARAMWFNDRLGLIRVKRLVGVEDLNITNPNLADASWIVSTSSPSGGAINRSPTTVGQNGEFDGFSLLPAAAYGAAVFNRTHVAIGSAGLVIDFVTRQNGSSPGANRFGAFDVTAAAAEYFYILDFMTGAITIDTPPPGGHTAVTVATKIGETAGVPWWRVRTELTGLNPAHTYAIYLGWIGQAASTSVGLYLGDLSVIKGSDIATTIQQSQMEGMTQIQSSDPNSGLPRSRTMLRYSRNYQPMQGTEILGAVEGDARALLEKEWLEAATDFDADVLAAHPLASFELEETLLVEKADADAEAADRQSVFRVNRFFFDVPTRIDATIATLEIDDVVALASGRYGMGGGTCARVLGVDPDPGNGLVTLSTWM